MDGMSAFLISLASRIAIAAAGVDSGAPPAPPEAHVPPAAEPVEVDWIRFASGEWLNDSCQGMTTNELTFDSDQVGEIAWDFDDVTDLVLAQPAVFVFQDKTVLSGMGRITPNRVLVRTEDGIEERPRSGLLQIVMGEQREVDRWSFDVKLGADISAGNSRLAALSGEVELSRVANFSRFEASYLGSLGVSQVVTENNERDWQTTVNNHRGRGFFEWYFTRRFFWRVVAASLSYDELQGIALKFQPGTLAGWQPVDSDRWIVNLAVGGGYLYTNFINDANDINTGGVVGTTEIEWSPIRGPEVEASTAFFADMAVDRPDNQTSVFNRLDFSFDLTRILDMELTFLHEFVAVPRGTNPTTGLPVQSNDFQLIVGLEASIL